MSVPSQARNRIRLDRTGRLVLGAALALILLSAAQLAYRYFLPTDGWVVITSDSFEEPDWIYWDNLVGAPSSLQREDTLLAIEDQSLPGTATLSTSLPPAGWIAGNHVSMTVLRRGQRLTFDVPVVNWTLRAWWNNNVAGPEKLINWLGALALVIVGGFTFLRRPNVPSARALLILCAAIFANGLSGMLPDGLSVQFDRLAFITTAFFSYVIFGTVLAPSLLAFSLLFPRPKKPIQRHPWLALLPYGLGLVVLIALASGLSAGIGWVTAMGMFLASIVSLVHAGFTQRDAVSRAQLRWAVGGFVVGLGLILMVYPSAFGWVSDPLLAQLLASGFGLGITVIGLSLAIAVLRYRLYDIDLIIRKTAVYAAVTALLLLVYFGSVILLQSIFASLTGEQSPIAIVLSTLLIAALFNPVRHRAQDTIDRRFFRQKYDAGKMLAAFAETSRDEVDLDQLTAEMLQLVNEAMQPESATLWLKPPAVLPGSMVPRDAKDSL